MKTFYLKPPLKAIILKIRIIRRQQRKADTNYANSSNSPLEKTSQT